MDSNPDKSPGLALPQPSMERATVVGGFPEVPNSQEIRPETIKIAPTAAPTVPAISLSPVQTTPALPSVPDPDPTSTTSAASDDDIDALDKEWVSKAKAIVERTKSDPFSESKELSKAKADYLRIRYSKHIKVAEEQ